jgi:hypothetical protein
MREKIFLNKLLYTSTFFDNNLRGKDVPNMLMCNSLNCRVRILHAQAERENLWRKKKI